MKQKPQPLQWFVLCLSLLPPCMLALLISKYSVDLPQWDQWAYVTFFEKLSRASLTFGDLFAQVNEYRQFFPNLVFVALGWLTHWDVRYEMAVIFLTACFISLNIYRLANRTISGDRTSRLFLLLLANLLIFSPAQYENWLQGQQLVYYFPIACVTTCLLVGLSGRNLKTKFGACGCLSVVSTFSSANGILCWLVVLPLLFLADSSTRRVERRWLVIAWTLGLSASAALYLFHYHKPWWSPSPSTALFHPLRAVAYFFGFLGAPLAMEKGKIAAVVGFVLISAFGLSCFYFYRNRADAALTRRMVVWLTIGGYSILTAVMTTIGRVGFGFGQSQNTRYIGYSVYLTVALVYLVRIITQDFAGDHSRIQATRLRRVAFLFAGVLVLLQPFIFVMSINRMAEMRTTLLQAKAMVLFINVKPDSVLIKTLYPDLNYLILQANELNRLGFLRPALIGTPRVQDFAAVSSSKPVDYGSWDQFRRTDNDYYLASGKATLPYRAETADAIILGYQTNSRDTFLFRIALPQKASAGFWHRQVQPGQWQVSFSAAELPAQPGTLTAWAFDANSGKAFRLNGSFEVPESNQSARNHEPIK